METLILGWYVLVETKSVLLLTLFASLTYIGTLIAPIFGVAGDRIGHRDLLAMMRATYAVLAGTLMTLALTGYLTPLYVFIIAAIMGLVRPSDLGVRGALVATIMPHDQLIGAISISRTTMDTARIAGALSGAALFAALGMGPAYVAITGLYVLGTLLTLCVVTPWKSHPADASPPALRSPIRDLKEGVAYVWTTPRMRAAIWIAFLANLTAYPLSNGLLPYIAREISRYQSDRTWLPVGEFRHWLIGRIYSPERDWRHPCCPINDRLDSDVVCGITGICTDANHSRRDRLPDARRICAKPDHDLDCGDPDEDRKRAFSRPGYGGAHARDLQLATGSAGGRQPHRRDRICCNGYALRGCRPRADPDHRAALAGGAMASPCTGEWEVR